MKDKQICPLNRGLSRIWNLSRMAVLAMLTAGLLMVACNGGHPERKGVDSAMNVNDQKIDDSVVGVSSSDAEFIVKAANGGMAEVQAGEIAQKKATVDDVKAFADKMVEDHKKVNAQLKSLAEKLDITLPSAIDGPAQGDIDKLNNTKSVDFNKTYMDMMVNDHDSDVDLFKKAAENTKNGAIHDFAVEVLPTLQSHQQMAKKLQGTL